MPEPEWIGEYPLQVTTEENAPEAEAEASVSPVQRMGATYAFGRYIVAPLGRLVYRPRVEGKGNVPKTGPVIFASNHLSFIDSVAIPVAAPRPVHFLAKSSYFEGTGLSGWLTREFFLAIGAVPDGPFFVTQDGSTGLVSFYDPASGDVTEVAGFAAPGFLDGRPFDPEAL